MAELELDASPNPGKFDTRAHVAPHIRIACERAGITDTQRMLNIQAGRESLAPPAMTVHSPPSTQPAPLPFNGRNYT